MGLWSETPLKPFEQGRVGGMLDVRVRRGTEHSTCTETSSTSHITVIPGACSVFRVTKLFMLVLIRYCIFPRIPSSKQIYSSNSFTGSRLVDDYWAGTLQLMKALLFYSNSHQLRNWACVFQVFWRLRLPFLWFTVGFWGCFVCLFFLFSLDSCPEDFNFKLFIIKSKLYYPSSIGNSQKWNPNLTVL